MFNARCSARENEYNISIAWLLKEAHLRMQAGEKGLRQLLKPSLRCIFVLGLPVQHMRSHTRHTYTSDSILHVAIRTTTLETANSVYTAMLAVMSTSCTLVVI